MIRPSLGSGRSYTSELTRPSSHGISVGVHVTIQVVLCRMRALDRKREGIGDFRLDAGFHRHERALIKFRRAGKAVMEQMERIDRFPRGPLRFVAIAGPAVVARTSMRPEAIHRRFNERRALTCARPGD